MRFVESIPKILKRLIGFAILGAFLLFIGLGVINYFTKPDTPPDPTEAPWAVQTSSRFYLARQIKMVDGRPLLNGYWTLEGNHYVYHDKVIEFRKDLYGDVKIIRRK